MFFSSHAWKFFIVYQYVSLFIHPMFFYLYQILDLVNWEQPTSFVTLYFDNESYWEDINLA